MDHDVWYMWINFRNVFLIDLGDFEFARYRNVLAGFAGCRHKTWHPLLNAKRPLYK